MKPFINPITRTNRIQLLLLLLLCGFWTQGQSQTRGPVATGVVRNSKGEALGNVAVAMQNQQNEAVASGETNEKGIFTFSNLPVGGPYHFIFSHIGFVSDTLTGYSVQEKARISLAVTLRTKSEELNVVVVTALGIRREEKSLGYAAQTIKENAVQDAKTNNWVNALSGKVAGLNIQGAGAGPMGSSRITLRGESSLNLDNNQALIIVDGVPVSKRITGTGYSSHLSADNPVDFGSQLSDINPDDIEKVTVLKGAGATALYGSRAAGGAILITTKSGQKKDKGLGITYNSNISIDQVNRWPDYQFEYGEGRTDKYYSYGNSEDGTNTSTTVAAGRAFGPKFNGQMYFQYDPNTPDNKPTQRTPWVAHDDYISGFFRTGLTITNGISIEGGGDRGAARLSLTHLKNQWILPNTGFERINAALSVNQKISNRLKINGKVNYTNKKSDNLPGAGYNNQSIMYFLIIGTAPNIRPEWFKPYWMPGQENVKQRNPFNTGPDNPYLDLYEMLNKMNKHGVIGTLSANYEISPKLELMVRTGTDLSFEFRSQQRPFSMTKFPNGSYREQNIFNYEINTDALLTYNDRINKNFRYSISAGGNAMRSTYDFAGMYADQLAQPGVYMISNSLDPAVADPQKIKKAINSLYATGQLNFKDKIFLDVTGRNDWSSTLPKGNNSYFYPSVSTSVLLSEMLTLPSPISFAKLRLSWAQVGNDTDPYRTAKYYDKIYSNGLTNPPTLFNPDLKPEITSSMEAGLDLRFLNGRIGVDFAVYNNNSRNQIITLPVDPVSGYNSKVLNAGLINSRGAELMITGKPIVNKNFSWTTTINWSMNRSYVKELEDGIPNQVIYAHGSNVSIEARVGGRMGDMYGSGFQRNEEGKIIYTSIGLPAPVNPVMQKWGNAFADWKAGLMNEFTIRNVRVSILLDGQKGGSMYSQTNHKNNTLGKTKVTLPGRDEGIVGDGVVWDAAAKKYVPNTVRVNASTYYETIYAINNAEMNIFDASYLKIREVRFEFAVPRKLVQKLRLQQASIALYGRDLFNFTSFPGFDPEGGNLNNGTLTPGVELTQFPSTRTMGVNLTVKF
ncbi:SusC/RagA family TonB-linked outer membrane protein [Pseudobacter ginsenosidimutans]|uniref:TonB-linked SusC/RagA family outer membrane protein n=1 Tax=Pseudobacter ginsenosidimutans TaxID=661488 RepID=A0A4Q7MVI7_9BACT|nr:SusC/RagA family TonB-linked outer membrane protein [Pseudobacter ginsenosidimutans]QEC41213.1 SusC/RagA family TonB-linked outer membrane protein [Pseudobacter ginsenosidimutans]RZS72014.1 TonB-linked SusC/RagA family outer membrane protein [Pseudobacter ginsenosidimutans]